MKILFIAPLPPPITGHSLVSDVLKQNLIDNQNEIFTINLSKESFKEGIDGFKRIFQVVNIFKDIYFKKSGCDRIYLTISESFAGNIKDLFIYIICYMSLNKMFIHLHGGSIKRQLWDKYPLLKRINSFFIKRTRGVIISGESHNIIFSDIISRKKIHLVPNFAQDYLFVDQDTINLKYHSPVIKILYMSNLIPQKGYNELLEAFLSLDEKYKKMIQLDFAGAFDSIEQKEIFLKKICGYPKIKYHGIVSNEIKKQLFANSHIFCLPTSYFEGQPVSILEAYAAGCVVLTTAQSGILDIFQPGINGFIIEQRSPESIRGVIESLFELKSKMFDISSNNLLIARNNYRASIYCSNITKIFES